MGIGVEATSELAACIDALAGEDATTLADADTVLALRRQAQRLAAVVAGATAALDADGAWRDSGARSSASFIANRSHEPIAALRRDLALGRSLRAMPAVQSAWLSGDIGAAHVGLLCRSRTDTTADAFARDEATLVGHASEFRFSQFERVLSYWRYHADPDGSEDEAAAVREHNRVHLSEGFRGRWFLDGALDPISGAIISDELKGLEKALFEADWAQAKAELGREPLVSELARTPPQRRAAALVEMARRSAAMPEGSRLPRPLFSVLVGWETLNGPICELANRSMVTPGSLVPWLAVADLERVVFDPKGRPIDVGVSRRLFTGATRRAIQVRDQECFHPECDEVAADCEIDHVEPHGWGGWTTVDNGRVACGPHNRARNRRPQPPV